MPAFACSSEARLVEDPASCGEGYGVMRFVNGPVQRATLAGGMLFLIGASLAAAQPAPAPAGGAPQPAAASPAIAFGDWALRCVDTPPPAGAKDSPLRTCEIAQTLQLRGQGTILAQLAVGRTKAGEPLRFTIVLPPNIGLPSTVEVVVDEKGKSRLDVPWKRCIPGACVAELTLTEKTLQQLRNGKGTPNIAYPNAAGAANAVVFSLKGFGDAVDALNKAHP